MNYVTGQLPKNNQAQLGEFKRKLINMGYQVNETPAQLEFSKVGQIEAVLIELSSPTEQAGWNVWSDLHLQEHLHNQISAKYQDGRINREE